MDYTGQSLDRGQDDKPKLPEQPLDTDFAKKFPPDPMLGDEMAPAARVWKVYRAEAEAHDGAMLDGWNKTLDVLLIFAGLFSAVATAFLIDSYKLLQPDDAAAYMSTALYLLVMQANVSSTISLPLPPPLASSSSTISRAVNWLWFTSLLLSLSVALLGILIKQWIVEYNSRNTASAESPRRWAIRHRMFFHAMITWPVADLVSVLPVMLHASLFLFFSGVALFVWDLDLAIGIWVAVLGLLLGVFYMACTLLPLWIPECPTSTPLVHLVRRYFVALKIGVLQICVYLCTRTAQLHALARRVVSLIHQELASEAEGSSITSHGRSTDDGRSGSTLASDTETSRISPGGDLFQSQTIRHLTAAISLLRDRQKESLVPYVPEHRLDTFTADGLLWLMFSVADSDARAVGMQALGAVPSYGALSEHLRSDTRLTRMDYVNLYTRSAGGKRPVEIARIVRSMLWSRDSSSAPVKAKDINLWVFFASSEIDYPDMLFLRAVKHTVLPEAGEISPPPRRPSASISSTVLLFLRARHLGFTDLVKALLWCDFDHFLDDDWTFILERIVSEGSTRTSPQLLPRTDPLVRIVDVLAQCIMQSAAVKNNITVHQLLISLLKKMARDYDYDRINFSSSISAYLLSVSFAEQQMQPDVLQGLISTLLCDAWRVVDAYPPAMESCFTLLSSLLPLLLRQQRGVPSDTCFFCASVLNSADRIQNGQVLSLALRRIFMPTEHQPLLSVWDMLRDSDGSGYLVWSLARTLCLAERALEDVSAMVDIFLSHLSLRSLLQIFRSTVEYQRRGNLDEFPDFYIWVAPIVQYCVDLRPAWWFKSLSDLREDEDADIELKQYLPELEAIPLYRGPCDVCHRLPRGWLDDDDPLSSCGFNPARPVPSTLANSLSTPDSRAPWFCPLCGKFSPAS